MGNKRKASSKFGKCLGRHVTRRKLLHTGRPTYSVIRFKNGKLKIRKIHKLRPITKYQKPLNEYTAYSSSKDGMKMKFTKVKDISPKGYRLINLHMLEGHVSQITMHVCQCLKAMKIVSEGNSPIKLVSEVRSLGLACVLMAKCQGCEMKFTLESSPKVPGTKRFDINVRAVWGSMVTGNGPAHLNEMLATMDSPGLSQPTFTSIETEIGKWWHDILEKDMLLAGEEERSLVIDRNDFHQEVPAITVVTDGGWSKRTHKHSYNAAGGVAIIIGQQTKKLLHIGVRNKYCYLCSQKSEKVHTCFKNWDRDSQSMESDIILEGFRECEEKHGVRYMRVVGDGDSSVFARIREEISIWGRFVQKEECANHVSKCYRSNLEKLVSNNPLYKGKNNLTKSTRVRLTSALRCAIHVRSKEYTENTSERRNIVKKLSHDIRNSVHHVFGKHDNCSDFCRAGQSTASNSEDPSLDHSPESVEEEQGDFWTEGSSITSQESSRYGSATNYQNVEQHIITDVTTILNRIAEKSDRLINNSTTNLAENWMHIRTKFDGGKVHNICNRGSWHARCYGGALRMNKGPQWACDVWQSSTATEPGTFFRKLYARNEVKLTNSTKHKSQPHIQARRWKKKMTAWRASTTKTAKKSYGPEAVDVTVDVEPAKLEEMIKSYEEKHINILPKQMEVITKSTSKQSQSGLWHSERKKRLTASNFGSIVRRNPSLPIQKFVHNLLYSTFRGNRHTRNGILQEETTIEEYVLKKAEEGENLNVQPCGLVIHPVFKFLAASPDGLVIDSKGEKVLVEIKNLVHSKPINLYQASTNKNFCLEMKDSKLNLKTNHIYFYQCHGLLNVCDKMWIDFIVRTLNPHQIFIQRIYKDEIFWQNHMLPKLTAFYRNAILPELACPRDGKSPGIREPGLWVCYDFIIFEQYLIFLQAYKVSFNFST